MVDLSRGVIIRVRGHGGERHHGLGCRAVGAPGGAAASAVGDAVGHRVGLRVGVERVAGCRRRGRCRDGRVSRNAAHRAPLHLSLRGAARITGCRAQISAVEHLRKLPIRGRDLHHHVVLVERIEDRGDGALSVGIVQHGIDLIRGEAVALRGCALNVDVGLQAILLHVGIHVDELGVILAELLEQLRGPCVQARRVVARQGVLVFGGGLPAADAQILHGLQEQPGARYTVQLRPQPRDHLIGRELALRQGLERHVDGGGVEGADAGETDDRGHGGIGLHDLLKLLQFFPHRLKRDALVGNDLTHEQSVVLLGEQGGGQPEHQYRDE